MIYGLDFCNGGTATSNGGYQTPDKGFDNNNATYYQNGNSTPCWCKYDLGAGVVKKGRKYTITLSKYGSNCPSAWIFQGSNNNVNWDTLDSQSGITWSSAYQKKEFEFINTTYYRYYMWTFSAPNAPICIAEFEIMAAGYQLPLCYLTSRKRERYIMKPISSLNYVLFQNAPTSNARGAWNSPTMSSNNLPEPYVTSASTEYGSGYAAWRAFDKNNSTRWSTKSGNGLNSWIKMYVGNKTNIIITQCTMKAHQRMSSFIVQGSNNNTNWTDIYSGNMANNTDVQTFSFSNNTTKYDYIRIYCTSAIGTVSLWEVTFSGYYKSYYNYLRRLRDRFDMSSISTKNWYNI